MYKVKINSDSLDQITTLYDIGPILARRIIEYRETSGYFSTPDDLAKVEGVSLELSHTLSPYIDWQVPTELLETKDRDYLWFLIFLIVALYHLYFVYVRRIPTLLAALNNYFLDRPGGLIWIFIQSGLLAYSVFLALFSLSWAGCVITTNMQLERKLKKASLVFLILALVSVVLIVIFNVIYYQFFSPSGWQEFFSYKTNLNSAVSASGIGLIVISVALALWKPLLVSRTWFEWVFYIGFLLLGIGGITIPFTGNEFYPRWFLVFYFIYGIFSIKFGWSYIRQQYIFRDMVREYSKLWNHSIAGDSSAS